MTQQLDVCPLLRMAAQIPAWQPSLVWKHSLDASLSLGRIETERCLSVLLQHGIVVIHRHRAVSIASGRRPHPENGIVQNIGQNDCPNHNTDHGDEDSSQPHPKAWGRCLGHDARVSPCLANAPPPRSLSGLCPRPASPVCPDSAHVDNSPIRQANYRIRRESLLARVCCGPGEIPRAGLIIAVTLRPWP